MRKRSRVLIVAALLLAVLALALFLAAGVSRRAEVDRLAQALALRDGMVVAEIGAGRGWLTVEAARRVAPSGRVYSTELSPDRIADIREAAADAGLANITVIDAGESTTNLPPGCCDAIFMRRVYHHFSDPSAMVKSIGEALKPSGVLMVIEIRPSSIVGLVLRHATGEGELIDQVTAGGFDLIATEEWPGWGHYAGRFRKR